MGLEGETRLGTELNYTSVHIHRNLWGTPGHKDTCIIRDEDIDRASDTLMLIGTYVRRARTSGLGLRIWRYPTELGGGVEFAGQLRQGPAEACHDGWQVACPVCAAACMTA